MQIDKRHLLQKVWLFAHLDPGELDLILPLTREHACPAERVLVQQGDTSGDMFAVLQGRVKVVTSVDGEEILLTIMGPGEVFGEIALLDGGARSATVITLESCRLLVLPRAAFQSLLYTVPSLGSRLLATMAKRVRTLTERAEDSSLRDVPGRLAKAILALLAQFGVPAGPGKIRITLKLSQMELGNLIGATREMVNRCLGQFTRRRWLHHRQGILTVLDEAQLRAAAEKRRTPVRRKRHAPAAAPTNRKRVAGTARRSSRKIAVPVR